VYFSDTPTTYTGIEFFYCLLSDFFRICSCFRSQRVVFFAVLAKTALRAGAIFTGVYLIFRLTTFGAETVFFYF